MMARRISVETLGGRGALNYPWGSNPHLPLCAPQGQQEARVLPTPPLPLSPDTSHECVPVIDCEVQSTPDMRLAARLTTLCINQFLFPPKFADFIFLLRPNVFFFLRLLNSKRNAEQTPEDMIQKNLLCMPSFRLRDKFLWGFSEYWDHPVALLRFASQPRRFLFRHSDVSHPTYYNVLNHTTEDAGTRFKI